ncbi:siroheme synthase CysG [Litorimonas sp.]|uniref:siroheme synthase CysG n=1 Tax=Litorimonas sp. TaxID=1892381 RepID=UPI003A8459AE
MRYLPIHIDTKDVTLRVIGGGEAAEAKLRTLLKTEARLEVVSDSISAEISRWSEDGRLVWIQKAFDISDLDGARLVYAATEDDSLNAEIAAAAHERGVLANAADQKSACAFITPALVDRSPVLVSIGTEGTTPGLARALKADLEKRLPADLGKLALLTKKLRAKVKTHLPDLSDRQTFWARIFGGKDLTHQLRSDAKTFTETVENALLNQSTVKTGQVALVGAGPGNPDLLTFAAQQALHGADVIIYDRLVSHEVLELGRREAEYIYVGKTPNGPSVTQDDINSILVDKALKGFHVVRLKGGDPLIFGRADEEISVLHDADIPFRIVPGITAAAGAAAEIGASLTTRGKNSSVTFLTGHDVKGYAKQDWKTLAKQNSRAIVYMGVGASRFIQGRLLIHGASKDTPVTVVENATRPNQKVVSTQLSSMADDMAKSQIKGPAVLMLGYSANKTEIPDIFKAVS